MFVSAGFELKIHENGDKGLESYPFQQHLPSPSRILSVSICNDNSYIALVRENEKPQILCAKDKSNIRIIHTINVSNVSVVAFKRNTKKNIALGTSNGDIIIYDTKNRAIANSIPKVCSFPKNLDFTCDDQQLCGFDGDTIFVFPEINNSDTVLRYKQSSECTMLRCHPFLPNRAAVSCKNGHIALWDVERGVETLNLEVFVNCPASGLAMSSCGDYFMVFGKDKIKICGTNNGMCNFEFYIEQEKDITSMDLSCDDRFLAVGLSNGTLNMYDVKEQLKKVYGTKVHEGPIEVIVFENKVKEINSNFSLLKMSEPEVRDQSEEVYLNVNSLLKNRSSLELLKEESLEKMKRNIYKVVKNEMDCLENQLHEHCVKFQKFLDNEFDTIDGIIKKKWDIFNVGDMTQIIKTILPDDSKSNFT